MSDQFMKEFNNNVNTVITWNLKNLEFYNM